MLALEPHGRVGFIGWQLCHRKAAQIRGIAFWQLWPKRKKRKVWRCWGVAGGQQKQIWDVTRGALMSGKWFSDSHAPCVLFSLSPHPYIYHPCSPFWAQWFSHQTTDFRGKKESIKVTSSHGGHHLSLVPLVQPETWAPPCSPLGCPTQTLLLSLPTQPAVMRVYQELSWR